MKVTSERRPVNEGKVTDNRIGSGTSNIGGGSSNGEVKGW